MPLSRTVIGESMRPALGYLDECVCVPFDGSRARPGDIVTFRRQDGSILVYRVISGPRPDGHLVVKGDNTPKGAHFTIPCSAVLEKVSGVNKNGRFVSLESLPARFSAKVISFLSFRGLMPSALRRRYFDPLMMRAADSFFFKLLRRGSYGNVVFMTALEGPVFSLNAFVGKSRSAKVMMKPVEGKGVCAWAVIRRRDRNPVFAGLVIRKAAKESGIRFGAGGDLFVLGADYVKRLLSDGVKELNDSGIYLLHEN